MSTPGPRKLHLPNTTVERLALGYVPFHWPELGKFAFQGGFSVKPPWEGFKEKKWYATELRRYEKFAPLVQPYTDEWVEADCIAALVPDADGQVFTVHINGVKLEKLSESGGLRRRMLLQKLPILVTTCAARLAGGGNMPHGEPRSYSVSLDIKPFSR